MPWNLFAKSQAERDEEERHKRSINAQIDKINREIELYDSRGWKTYFQPRLEKILTEDTNALIGCPENEVPVVRARIKIVRHLVELKETLERERADLQQQRVDAGEDE